MSGEHRPAVMHAALEGEVRGIRHLDLRGLVRQQPGKDESAARADQGGKAWRQLHERPGENIGQHQIGTCLWWHVFRQVKREPAVPGLDELAVYEAY